LHCFARHRFLLPFRRHSPSASRDDNGLCTKMLSTPLSSGCEFCGFLADTVQVGAYVALLPPLPKTGFGYFLPRFSFPPFSFKPPSPRVPGTVFCILKSLSLVRSSNHAIVSAESLSSLTSFFVQRTGFLLPPPFAPGVCFSTLVPRLSYSIHTHLTALLLRVFYPQA